MTADRPMGVDQFESALRDILRAEADVRMPEHLAVALDETLRTTPTALQQGWRPARATGLLRSTFGATRFVVAAVIVALFGGFLLAGVLTTRPEETRPAVGATTTPDSMTSPPIELPAEIPDGIESGTLETPLGPARWVHLSGDATTIPPALDGLVSTPDGYVVPKGSSPYLGGGEAELWRSSDTRTWQQISLEGLVPPGPDGYAWAPSLGRPLTYGGVTIVPFEWARDWWVVARGLPGALQQIRGAHIVENAPGVFDIIGIESGTFTTVRFEETEDGLLEIDHDDGTELMVLEGVSMEFIKMLAGNDKSGWDERYPHGGTRLAIIDGMVLVEVEHPLEVLHSHYQAYDVDGEGFVSYTIAGDGLVQVHRSRDGREWSETDLIGDDADEPTDIGIVWTHDGAVSVGTSDGHWTSTDGLAWEPFPAAPEAGDPGFLPVGTGWIIDPIGYNPVTGVQDVRPGNVIPHIWFQPKEGEPVPIDFTEMALPMDDGCGDGIGLLSPNTVAGHYRGCAAVPNVWIITFEDVPS